MKKRTLLQAICFLAFIANVQILANVQDKDVHTNQARQSAGQVVKDLEEKTGYENLYMAWRDGYNIKPDVTSHSYECPMCKKCKGNDDEHFVIARSQNFVIALNRFPYSKGHILIFPTQHEGKLENLTPEQSHELIELAAKSVPFLKKVLGCDGVNVGLNLGGYSAGASVGEHLHMHLVPRYDKDKDNFLHIIAQTRAILWNMRDLHAQLKEKAHELSLQKTNIAEKGSAEISLKDAHKS